MPTPRVWSEREQRPGFPGWHDCTQSAVLMALVFGGFTGFPLGAYSDAEREALERADDRPDETGATFTDTDLAVKRRYGLSMPRIRDGSAAGLERELRTAGIALAIAGQNARLSAPARRWDPAFDGAHAVAVVPQGDGTVLWLDPLAPMGFAGDRLDVGAVLRWAWIPSDARRVARDAYRVAPLPAVQYRLSVQPGTYTLFRIPGGTSTPTATNRVSFSRASWAPVAHGSPGYWQVNAGYYLGWYYIAGRSGPFTVTDPAGHPVDPAR